MSNAVNPPTVPSPRESITMRAPTQTLTLVVATTPVRTLCPSTGKTITRLGIGLNGTLPWPRIKSDMSFFARVTARPPREGTTNAIVMGRKTYLSLPGHLRPLAKRINVVVSRNATGPVQSMVLVDLETQKAKKAATAATVAQADAAKEKKWEPVTDAIVCSGLDSALETLRKDFEQQGKLGKVFVIGGGEIYASSLQLSHEGLQVRVVMTKVKRRNTPEGKEQAFECDTFFPVDEMTPEQGWREATADEVTDWVGETVSSDWKEDGDVAIQIVGYEKTL
ncbi:hypothetical protein PVAR5_1667 [Paecilomyces variotii No. 5]|uniref:Dihydrofolate reductase n=1 Tax=Byssochlamys spectabilis (strain No. 5 / NBRC 109023) TaxID=1356009 RepID=V5FWS3_BYSSN|nr:hypothetical protein PVAR5_1667 [Paecilomyces variotii No. 5]